ncbi:MAG: phosphoacceptor domain-containing protein, partial [Symploca sp. SIO2G7]|nr:phosphoacceptor domain-containing protein [Symploca sp. SIO2G7]
MHFIAMLAFNLPQPVTYNLLITLLSANLLILGLTILSVLFDQYLAAQSAREEILQESDKHFRMLIREMPVGVLLLTPDFKIIVSNQAAIALLGITDSQVLELGLVLQEDGTPFTPENLPMQQVLATCQPVHHVTIGINCALSQTPRWLLVNADPQLSAEGMVERIVCTFSNITPAKQAESALRLSEAREREKATQLSVALQKLKKTQAKLVQTEKMFSLGQLVAGVAHEINNPVNFIYGNLTYVSEYASNLLELVHLYQQHYPYPTPDIQQQTEAIELDFLKQDLPKLLESMKIGTERIRQIVLSLKNFSRYDEAEMKLVDIHQGIDNTLLILGHRLKAIGDNTRIEVIKDYGDLPFVECYPGQINQVFMNILSNGIDALEEARTKEQKTAEKKAQLSYQSDRQFPCIWIRTLWNSDLYSPQRAIDKRQPSPADYENETDSILISIADNGSGMTAAIRKQLFDPFFTTKSVGKGTGLGLAISYQIIVEKHG